VTRIGLVLSGLASGSFSWDRLMTLPGRVDDAMTVAHGAVGVAVPVASILAEATIDPSATHGTVTSSDGTYTASIPIETLRSGGWLAVALDDEALPADRGGPLRLTVAEGDTLCWNVKDVGGIHFTMGPEADSVPENPPH
jgi:DMSO/TMAO reductase YedYZ molybdopterin-dependent catalytic subunit